MSIHLQRMAVDTSKYSLAQLSSTQGGQIQHCSHEIITVPSLTSVTVLNEQPAWVRNFFVQC